MIACHVRYVIDPRRVDDFEHYARLWIPLVERHGGTHLGYFLPSGGTSNEAMATFTFPSISEFTAYRIRTQADPDCQAARDYAARTQCIVSYEAALFRHISHVGT